MIRALTRFFCNEIPPQTYYFSTKTPTLVHLGEEALVIISESKLTGALPLPAEEVTQRYVPSGSPHKEINQFQRSRHHIRLPYTPALAHAPPTHQAHRAPTSTSAVFICRLARNARAYTSARAAIGFCAIWVCISSSSSSG